MSDREEEESTYIYPLKGLRSLKYCRCIPLHFACWFAVGFSLWKCLVFIIFLYPPIIYGRYEDYFHVGFYNKTELTVPSFIVISITSYLIISLTIFTTIFLVIGIVLYNPHYMWGWIIEVVFETLALVIFIFCTRHILVTALLYPFCVLQILFWHIIYSYAADLAFDEFETVTSKRDW